MSLVPFLDPWSTSIYDPYSNVGFPTVSSSGGTQPQLQQLMQYALQPVDVEELDDLYLIHTDVPGMAPEDITLEYQDQNQVLTIKGEHVEKQARTGGGYTRTERARRSFTRSFTVPSDVLVDNIQAAVENGVLTVTVPKKPAPPKTEPRRIPVSGSTKVQGRIGGGSQEGRAQVGGAGDAEGSAGGASGITGGGTNVHGTSPRGATRTAGGTAGGAMDVPVHHTS